MYRNIFIVHGELGRAATLNSAASHTSNRDYKGTAAGMSLG